jgi:DNA-binding SARP family transcriptional activator
MGVGADGREVSITAGRERILLAMLLLHANQVVSTDLLVGAIWSTEMPHNTRNQLQTCVYRLRKRLGDAGSDQQPIVSEPAGYRINVNPKDLDLYEFRRLVEEARAAATAGNHHDAKTGYRAALQLWRGPALAGIDSNPVRATAASLDEERVQALEECLHAELAAGGAGELVAELTELAARYPHREGLHRTLMLALYRAGRQADALAAYRHARQLLRDDLGTEPSAELQQLHHAILNREPALDAVRPPDLATAPPPPKPRELPADVAGFTGRVEALKMLDDLQPSKEDPTGPVVISAIAGTAGVGKTALAVHWAHRVTERFPDGQVYLNLRGYATGTPVRPVEALSMMLRSLGMAPDQIPAEEAEASARYRSLLADRRVLVVLDNAGSVDQVRPLLPGSPGCLALITSRDRLAGLVARDGAHRISLDVLPADEAHMLLIRLLGNERVAGEPEATADLLGACAYLPLALRIAAAALADRPGQHIQDFVSDLNSGQRLAALEVEGDRQTAVRATLDLSYRTVPGAAQRVFRLLGLVPIPDFTPDAVAALADLSPDATKRLLDRLANAHLVEEHLPGRYTFHDLLRDYARELAKHTEHSHESADAARRLLDWYLCTADAASRALHPVNVRMALPANRVRVVPQTFDDRVHALAWLDAERPNLVAAIQHAAEHGLSSVAVLLGDVLRFYLWNGSHRHDALTVALASNTAAQIDDALDGQASAQASLADAHFMHGDHGRAAECYTAASALARQCGWPEGEAGAENNLATVFMDRGQLQEAVRHLTRTRELGQQIGHLVLQASALSNLGYVQCELGAVAEAVGLWSESLKLLGRMEHAAGIAIVLANLGRGYQILGDFDQALDHLARSLVITKEIGVRGNESYVHRLMATAHHDAGRHHDALHHARTAITLVQDTEEHRFVSDAWSALGVVHYSLGDHREAVSDYERAHEAAGPIRFEKTVALIGLGAVNLDLGQVERASTYATEALKVAREVGYRILEGQALTVLAGIRLSESQPEQALEHCLQALDHHRSTGYRLGEAHVLVLLGRIRNLSGNAQAGREHLLVAHRLLEAIGAPVPDEVTEGLWTDKNDRWAGPLSPPPSGRVVPRRTELPGHRGCC